MKNAYLIIYRGKPTGVAIDYTGAKARYQMYLTIKDIWGKKNASFTDIRSRILEQNVDDMRTFAPLSIKYTRWKDHHFFCQDCGDWLSQQADREGFHSGFCGPCYSREVNS